MATTVANPTDLATSPQSAPDSQVPATTAAPGQALQSAAAASTSSLPSVREVLEQPAVRRSMPAIIALLTVAIFLMAYSWVQEPVYRTVYPGLSEADRQAAYEALSAGIPIFGYDAGRIKELVEQCEAGIVMGEDASASLTAQSIAQYIQTDWIVNKHAIHDRCRRIAQKLCDTTVLSKHFAKYLDDL